MDENQDIHKLIDEIVIAQSRMTKEDRLKRYAASLYPEPLDFVKEIDETNISCEHSLTRMLQRVFTRR